MQGIGQLWIQGSSRIGSKNKVYIMWLYQNSLDQLKSGFLGNFCSNGENGRSVALLKATSIDS